MNKSTRDPIVEEVHKNRLKRAKKFKHDVDAMFDDLLAREEQSRRAGVKFAKPGKRGQAGSPHRPR